MKRLNDMFVGRLALVLQGGLTAGLKRDEGQTLVEYALILATIAIALVLAMTFLRDQIATEFSKIGDAL
jgi:Flp pilus assembly pilin Flp